MTNREKPGGAVEGAHPAQNLPARTSISSILHPTTIFNARLAAKQLACVLAPCGLWSSSILHRVVDEFGYVLLLWQCDAGWMVELSRHPDVPAPNDIGVGALGPSFCTATPTSKRRAIALLWETQAQLNAAGLRHATTFLPMGDAWSS